VGALRNAAQQVQHLGRDLSVGAQLGKEAVQLAAVRQLAVPEQVYDFFVCGVLRQVVNVVSSIREDAVYNGTDGGRSGDYPLEPLSDRHEYTLLLLENHDRRFLISIMPMIPDSAHEG